MALTRSPVAIMTTPLLLLLFLFLQVFVSSSYGYRGMVGGRTEITDVKTNEEVQDLGRFSVEEYNRTLSQQRGLIGGEQLMFTEVVEAQRQVVSGIKYYLKISAATSNGVTKMFDSVVVVKPWVHSDPQLLNFGPSTSTQYIRNIH